MLRPAAGEGLVGCALVLGLEVEFWARVRTYQQPPPRPNRDYMVSFLSASSECDGGLTAAFPPALRMSIPHLAANGCVQATMPFVLWTTLRRLLNFANSSGPGGNSEADERGIFGVFSVVLISDWRLFFGNINS